MKRRKPESLRKVRAASAFTLFCAAACIFLFSDDSRIRTLSCQGNYYYSSQQIYSIAEVSSNTRALLQPAFVMEKKLEEDPLIEDATVTVNGSSVSIDVQEKLIIGYYVRDGKNYMLTDTFESIPIEDETNMKNLIHFPLLADLSDEVMERIAAEFHKYPDYLDRQVLEKIAEILPWSESYDPDMIRMVMQDGNVVFTTIDSLHMIANYQAMLTELQGEDVCLVLDGENDTIDKIACDYLYMTTEERDQYRNVLKKQLEEAKKAAEEHAKKEQEEKDRQAQQQKQPEQAPISTPQNSAAQDSSTNTPQTQAPDSSTTSAPEQAEGNQQTPEAEPVQRVEADDWQPSQYSWLLYSPSTDTYQDIYAGVQYKWDDTTASFVELQ